MKDTPAQPGRVCLSKQGRDKGRYFMIYEVIDDKYVTIVDGQLRRLYRPKKKKLMHLSLMPNVLENIGEKIKEGKKIFDAEVRSALRDVAPKESQEEGGSESV